MRCSCFGGVETDLNPKLLTVVASAISFGLSKKYHFHRICLIKISSLNIRFLRQTFLIPSKSIEYAIYVATIEEKVIKTIYHARKSLLFDKENVRVKKDNPVIDVTMGNYDGAELCELVYVYLLDLLTEEFGKQNIGLIEMMV